MCFMPSLFARTPREARDPTRRHRVCLRTIRLAPSFPTLSLRMRRFCLTVLALVVAAGSARAADDWDAVVDKGIAYLKTYQNADGSWGTDRNKRGVTGIVVT